MNQLLLFLLTVNTKVDPSGAGEATKAATEAATSAAGAGATTATSSLFSSPIAMVVVYCVVIFGAMYFFSIKPQKKREKDFQEMRKQLQAGDSVLLTNGMYGKIADVTAECFIVEFGVNKGIRIPVLKTEVAGKAEPNLTNKVEEKVEEKPEKKSFFGFGKSGDENKN